MSDNQKNIKHVKKNTILIYIALEFFILLMAWLVLSKTGNLSTLLSEGIQISKIIDSVQNLYMLQTIFFSISFLSILGLLIYTWIINKKTTLANDIKTTTGFNDQMNEKGEDIKQESIEEKKKLMIEQTRKRKEIIETTLKKQFETPVKNNKIVSEKILSAIAKGFEITQAEIFLTQTKDQREILVLSSTFAFYIPEEKIFEFEIGEGLIGQVAKAMKPLYLKELPKGYISVKSGLGQATPNHLLIVPWKNKENKLFGIIEIASFQKFHDSDIELIQQLEELIIPYYQFEEAITDL
ncbi:MAG: GAF domain-containing protein [Bacteroidota bacterium]